MRKLIHDESGAGNFVLGDLYFAELVFGEDISGVTR